MTQGGSLDSLLGGGCENRDKGQMAQKLREMFATLGKRHVFVAGDLIQFKPGRRNYGHPHPGQPALFLGMLPEPVPSIEKDPRSPWFGATFDMKMAHLDSDGDLVIHLGSSELFEPYTGDQGKQDA